MRTVSLSLLAVIAALPAGVCRAADQDELQGKWIVQSFEFNGAPVETMLQAVREFQGDKYTLTSASGETFSGTIKLDESQTPRHIDLVMPDRTLKGIYSIEGDALKIAYTLEGDARPTELASKPGSGVALAIHKRAK